MLQYTIQALARLYSDRRGQDFIEYALIVAFVATSAAAISSAVAATGVNFGGAIAALAQAIAATADQ